MSAHVHGYHNHQPYHHNDLKPSAPPLEKKPNLNDNCWSCKKTLAERVTNEPARLIGRTSCGHDYHMACLSKYFKGMHENFKKKADGSDSHCQISHCNKLIGAVKVINLDKINLPEDDICAICCEEFSELPEGASSDVITKTGCNHFFHGFCLDTWLKNKEAALQTCPNCRSLVGRLVKLDLDGNIIQERVPVIEMQKPKQAQNPIPAKPIKSLSKPTMPVVPQKTEEKSNFALKTVGTVFGTGLYLVKESWNLAKWGYNLYSPKINEDHFEGKVVKVVEKWSIVLNKTESEIQESNNKVNLMLKAIESTATSAGGLYKKGEAAATQLEKSITEYNQRMYDAHEKFKKDLALAQKKLD